MFTIWKTYDIIKKAYLKINFLSEITGATYHLVDALSRINIDFFGQKYKVSSGDILSFTP